jgi:hypothetical protein
MQAEKKSTSKKIGLFAFPSTFFHPQLFFAFNLPGMIFSLSLSFGVCIRA